MKNLPHKHNEYTTLPAESKEFHTVSDLFKILSDPTRVRIFWILCHCEECVVNLSSLTSVSGPAVSHHLRALRVCGLVESRKSGREVYYRASGIELSTLLHRFIEEASAVSCPSVALERPAAPTSADRDGNAELIRRVHDRLFDNMSERITIDALAREFHINPTTLKKEFKSVYGSSVAAHIKEHRMERAAALLLNTANSVSEIARSVGYESQSKFSMAFKSHFGTLPTEYRKTRGV